MPLTNWAGNVVFEAAGLLRPESVAQLQEAVSSAPNVHAVGTRHSFNAIGDAALMLSLESLPLDFRLDSAAGEVSFSGPLTFGRLAELLNAEGLALHNLPSLPHISVVGAAVTGTHGSGDRSGNIATAVTGIEIVQSDGQVRRARRGADPDFHGLVVNLGALGAVSRVTIAVEKSYSMRQTVYSGLSWLRVVDSFDRLMTAGDSVSVFADWTGGPVDVWVKSRGAGESAPHLFGAPAAAVKCHPIPGADPENCTDQRGVPGLWSDRLPHFRMDRLPSSGDELQSEYFVARRDAVEALGRLGSIADRIAPLLQISELRTVAADELWLSPAFGRDSVGIHFTWQRRPADVLAMTRRIESLLEPLGARPHWAKLFSMSPAAIADVYPRLPDFVAVAHRMDPRGAFRNRWLVEHLGL